MRKLLVIGCGSIGRRHIRNLRALEAGEIIGFDPREDRRREALADGAHRTVASTDEAWKLQPDVALVTAPTSLHVPLALEAAEHGCHLFIEKPLSHSRDGVDKLIRLTRERGLVTLVGCNMRFHPGLRKVKALVDSGAIGKVVAARIEVGQWLPNWHPWEDYRQTYSARVALGGGVILDDIHEIDYARWMFGEVDQVACFAGRLSDLEIETEDTAAIILKFRSGALGEIHLDYVQRTLSRSCHVIGDRGTIRWDLASGSVSWFIAGSASWERLDLPAQWVANSLFVDEMRHFIACLDGKERSELDAMDASRVLDIALAAKAAARETRIITLEGLA